MNGYRFSPVRIIDGDTIVVTIFLSHPDLGLDWAIRNIHVRVFGIDTPERGKPGAAEATAAVRVFLDAHAERALVVCYGLDKFGRTLGDVVAPDAPLSLGQQLIADGLAQPLVYRVAVRASVEAGVPIWSQVREIAV